MRVLTLGMTKDHAQSRAALMKHGPVGIARVINFEIELFLIELKRTFDVLDCQRRMSDAQGSWSMLAGMCRLLGVGLFHSEIVLTLF